MGGYSIVCGRVCGGGGVKGGAGSVRAPHTRMHAALNCDCVWGGLQLCVPVCVLACMRAREGVKGGAYLSLCVFAVLCWLQTRRLPRLRTVQLLRLVAAPSSCLRQINGA